jgi:hypothetical protein
MSLGWDVGFREKRQKFNRDGSSKNALGTWDPGWDVKNWDVALQ